MSSLAVAGLQLDIAWEDPAENFRRAEALAARAAAAGARLLVLPEMFNTGFSMAAERVATHAAATRDFLANLARRHGTWVLAGYAEPAGGEAAPRPRNACALLRPDGSEALRYHKIHPFSLAGEDQHFSGGTALPTAEVEGVRVTALICYDLRFPEPFRAAATDTDLFVVVANWPDRRVQAWSTLLAARAIENQAYVLGVNRVGEGDGLAHSGRSALHNPMGELEASLANQAGLLLGTVEPAQVAEARQRFSFLADRRPQVYRGLER